MQRHDIVELMFYWRKFWRRFGVSLQKTLFVAVLCSTVVQFADSPFWCFINVLQLDVLMFLQGNRTPPSDIVVVGIDDETLRWLSPNVRQPIRRADAANLIRKLHEVSCLGIILDIVIYEMEDADSDKLADALRSGFSAIGYAEQPVNALGRKSVVPSVSDVKFQQAASMIVPLIVNNNSVVVDMCVDYDFNRELYRDDTTCPFMLKPVKKLLNRNIKTPPSDSLINFYGPSKTLNYISMKSVLSMPVSKLESLVKDKIVFVGFTAELDTGEKENASELFRVPGFWRKMFGMEIHATIAGNLIDGSWIRRLPVAQDRAVIFIGLAIIVVIAFQMTPFVAVVFLSISTIVWWILTWIVFVNNHLFVTGAGIVTVLYVLTVVAIFCYHNIHYRNVIKRYESCFRLVFIKEWNFKANVKRRISVAIIAAIVVVLLSDYPYRGYFDTKWLGWINYIRGKISAPTEVIIVGIDDDFITKYKKDGGAGANTMSFKQPIGRDVLAQAVDAINEGSPKLVIADLLLAGEAPTAEDEKLEKAMSAGHCYMVERAGQEISGSNIKYLPPLDFGNIPNCTEFITVEWNSGFDFSKITNELNAKGLFKKANYKDVVNIVPNRDMINFYGESGTINKIFLYDVLHASHSDKIKWFKDKVVFLGYATVIHRRELRENLECDTPGFGKLFNIEVNATKMGNLLDGSWLKRLDQTTEWIVVFVLAAISFGLAAVRTPIGALIVSVASLVVWSCTSLYAVVVHHLFIPGTLQFIIVWLCVCAIELFAENMKIRKIAKTKGDAFGITIALNE